MFIFSGEDRDKNYSTVCQAVKGNIPIWEEKENYSEYKAVFEEVDRCLERIYNGLFQN